MKKNLLYMVFGLMGLMGIGFLGTVKATDVTITYDLNGGYWVEDSTTGAKQVPFTTDVNGMVGTTDRRTPSREDECEENGEMKKCMFDGWYLENGARWTGYANSNMTVYAKWLPFEDLTITTGEVSFTIMDRNLGATASGTGCSNVNPCGYHFQWGNNYGFKPNTGGTQDFPNKEYFTGARLKDWQSHISTYYNAKWIDSNPWNEGYQGDDNLWGGSKSSNSDEDKQGPCPYGYHVPDTLEWKAVGTVLNVRQNGDVVRDILNLPYAGLRTTGTHYVGRLGTEGRYWSSTPNGENADFLYFANNYVYWQYSSTRVISRAVRCFKNSSQTLTFLVGDEVSTTKNFRWREPVIESYAPEVPEIENATFIGWFVDGSDNAFVFGSDTYISQDTTLNAKYQCNVGYLENDEKTACEKIRVEFNANGGNFGNGGVHIVNSTTNKISSDEKQYSHTANISDNGVASSVYANNLSTNDVVAITGAISLDIEVRFSTESATYDWLAIYPAGIVPTSSNYNSATISNGKLAGHGSYTNYIKPSDNDTTYHRKFTVTGDTAQFYFKSDSSNAYYGYYAEITEMERYEIVYESGAFDDIPQPSREGHKFNGWYLADGNEFNTGNVSTGEITKVYAKWECAQGYEDKGGECVKKSSGSSGGGGRSNKTSDTQDSSTSSQNDKNTENVIQSDPEHSEWGSEESSNTPIDSSDKSSEGQEILSPSDSSFTKEQKEAYEFAKEKGITTMSTIQDAQMDGKLTRIAMAKMLSQYAMNVLGQKPANIVTPKFNDVTDKQNSNYDDGVTLAYQLGIMGQNMPNNKFRPDDEVTRAEFATALSRMLYHTSDGEYKSTDKYYTNHMKKLVQEKIITNDDAKMKELRGYVMIMLMRSAK